MVAPLALLLCLAGILFLFYMDRGNLVRHSMALWLPVLWFILAGSRPVSDWIGMSAPTTASSDIDGSPIDAAIFGAILAIAIIVLVIRGRKTRPYLLVLGPLIAYFTFCLLSVMWSSVPVPALKRWTKDVGDVVMALVICTDPEPVDALRRFFSRAGFILLPLSVVLIRYTDLGRAWDQHGVMMSVGVTTHKNILGLISFLISLGALWNFRWLLMNRIEPRRRRRLLAEGILLACGICLLCIGHSSTSIACFLLGGTLMLVTHARTITRRPSRVHWLCLGIILAGGAALVFGGSGEVAHALDRGSTFTGRTDIWSALWPAVSNPIVGAGFDSFWDSSNVLIFQHNLTLLHWDPRVLDGLNEAHNGYIEIYLNLGWVGLCLIALILISGYWQATNAIRCNRELGSLALSFIITGSIYSITEAGFRTLNPMWIFILLAVVIANGTNARLFAHVTIPRKRSIGFSGIGQQYETDQEPATAVQRAAWHEM